MEAKRIPVSMLPFACIYLIIMIAKVRIRVLMMRLGLINPGRKLLVSKAELLVLKAKTMYLRLLCRYYRYKVERTRLKVERQKKKEGK